VRRRGCEGGNEGEGCEGGDMKEGWHRVTCRREDVGKCGLRGGDEISKFASIILSISESELK
jgi:hypothetical protein